MEYLAMEKEDEEHSYGSGRSITITNKKTERYQRTKIK
jgi:hypothetical protein